MIRCVDLCQHNCKPNSSGLGWRKCFVKFMYHKVGFAPFEKQCTKVCLYIILKLPLIPRHVWNSPGCGNYCCHHHIMVTRVLQGKVIRFAAFWRVHPWNGVLRFLIIFIILCLEILSLFSLRRKPKVVMIFSFFSSPVKLVCKKLKQNSLPALTGVAIVSYVWVAMVDIAELMSICGALLLVILEKLLVEALEGGRPPCRYKVGWKLFKKRN